MKKTRELTDEQKKGRFGCLGCLGVFFIAIVIIISVSIFNTGKEENLSDAENEKIKQTINEFEAAVIPYLLSTKDVVKNIKMSDVKKSDDFYVYVFLDELGWAKSTESEKMSIATTLGNTMQKIAGDTPVRTFIISDTNDDTLAEPRGSDYKINR